MPKIRHFLAGYTCTDQVTSLYFNYIVQLHFVTYLLMHITWCPSIFLMNDNNRVTLIQLNSLRMQFASSVQVPKSMCNFSSLQLYVRSKPLIFHSCHLYMYHLCQSINGFYYCPSCTFTLKIVCVSSMCKQTRG